jgi:hypothetical protein
MRHLRPANGPNAIAGGSKKAPATQLCYIFIDWGSCDAIDQCAFDFGSCGGDDICLVDY